MAEILPSYPCQQVVGDGQLCSMPCAVGFVRCDTHRNYSDKRALANMLEQAQDRVVRKVETALDDAVERLIHLSVSARSEQVQLQAIDKILTLTGFANIKIDSSGSTLIEPGDRDRVLMGIIRTYIKDPVKAQELERKAGAIDVKLDTDDDRGSEPG